MRTCTARSSVQHGLRHVHRVVLFRTMRRCATDIRRGQHTHHIFVPLQSHLSHRQIPPFHHPTWRTPRFPAVAFSIIVLYKKEGNHPHGHLFLAGAPGTSSLRVLRCAPLLLLAPDPRARLALPALRFGACSSGSCGSCEAFLLPPKRFLTHPKVSLFSSTHPSSVYGACSSLAR